MGHLDPGQIAALAVRLCVSSALLALGVVRARAASRRALGPQPWDVETLTVTVLLTTAVTVSAIALGAFGVLRDVTWALAAAGAFLALPYVVPKDDGHTEEVEPSPTAAFSVVLAGLVVGRLLYGLRNPPADWDSLYYHLPMLAHWLQSGTLGVPLRDPPSFGSYFPGGGEVLALWGAWAALRDALAAWPGVIALGMLGLAVRRAALRAGARSPIAEGVALCTALAPGLVQLTMGVRVDQLVALWLGIALLAALRLRRHGGRGDAALLVLALGLMVGTKSTGPVLATLVVLVALAGPGAVTRARALLAHPPALAVGLLTGCFWYARNALATGNPEFPAGLHLGSWILPGLLDQDFMRRTSQVAVWSEGFAGHTTPGHLLAFYGPSLVVLAVGVLVAIPILARSSPPGLRMLAATSLACALIYLFSPFSGAYWPSAAGRPPKLNLDNLRLVLPAVIAAAPVAAAGLSRLGGSGPLGLLLGLAAVLGLVRYAGHFGPGILVALVLLLAARAASRLTVGPAARRALAACGVVLPSVALAVLLVRVEPIRQRVSDAVWDGFARHIHNFDSATIRRLLAEADGRPIALSGVDAWWAYYGHDFSGRPVYLPVAADLPTSRRDTPAPEDRGTADRAHWLANVERSGAAIVVVGSPGGDCAVRYIEGDWAAEDSVRFVPLASRLCDHAWRVRRAGAAGAHAGPQEGASP